MSRYDKAKHSRRCISFFKILSIIFLIFIIGSLFYLAYSKHNSNKNKTMYEEISHDYTLLESDTLTVDINKEVTENMKKVASLKNENSDVIGWLQIDNTIIDYPLLQSTDNNYYLNHNYKNEKTIYGSIFAKNECDLLDQNSNVIIYGHNMQDKQMFNQLVNYTDKNYYDEHKTIKIATEQEENEYIILCAFKSRVFYQDENNVFRFYNYTHFDNADSYNYFVDNCKKIQLYDTGISAEYGEQLITLITCEYSQENGRFVVVAKKVNNQ